MEKQRLKVTRSNYGRTVLLPAMSELRASQQLQDVVLMCEGGEILQAHSAVLAATSSYFRTLLLKTWFSRYTVVALPQTSARMLGSLLDFMYSGEASVNKSEVQQFLELARAMQVTALCDQNAPPNPQADVPSSGPASVSAPTRAPPNSGHRAARQQDTPAVPPKPLPTSKVAPSSQQVPLGAPETSGTTGTTGDSRIHTPDHHATTLPPPGKIWTAAGLLASSELLEGMNIKVEPVDSKEQQDEPSVVQDSSPGAVNHPANPSQLNVRTTLSVPRFSLATAPHPRHIPLSHPTPSKSASRLRGQPAQGKSVPPSRVSIASRPSPRVAKRARMAVPSTAQAAQPPTLEPQHSGKQSTAKAAMRGRNCAMCPEIFFNKYHLTKHIQTAHLKLRLMCIQCGGEYANLAGLKVHQMNQHGKHSHPKLCSVCGKMVKNTKALKYHISAHHIKK